MYENLNIIVQDDRDRPLGYVAIHTLVDGTSSGGVRIAPDITLDEVKELGREMTNKFSFIGLPRGGAKSGILLDPGMDPREKMRRLKDFGRSIAPLVLHGIYYPGMDMNCGLTELKAIYDGAGMPLSKDPADTSFFTAVSVANALFACRQTDPSGKSHLTVAIEGFGSVGAYLAERLPQDQFLITAVSTATGAIRSETGFSSQALVKSKREFGDDFVVRFPSGTRIYNSELFTEEVDILIPSARTRVIHGKNIDSLRCRYVVPVANAPYAEDSVEPLHVRGIVCLPGFVTNSGGVYASSLYDTGSSIALIEEISEKYYRDVVVRLLERGTALNISPVRLAEAISNRRIAARKEGKGYGMNPNPRLRALFKKGVIPRSVYGRHFIAGFVRNLETLKRQITEYRVDV